MRNKKLAAVFTAAATAMVAGGLAYLFQVNGVSLSVTIGVVSAGAGATAAFVAWPAIEG